MEEPVPWIKRSMSLGGQIQGTGSESWNREACPQGVGGACPLGWSVPWHSARFRTQLQAPYREACFHRTIVFIPLHDIDRRLFSAVFMQ